MDYDVAGKSAELCGRYVNNCGGCRAARLEFESLAETGITLLHALKREVENNDQLREMASFCGLYRGHRGWLDAVRNTAHRHQSALLKITPYLWGISRDTRAQAQAVRRDIKRALARENASPSVLINEISPDIYTASGNGVCLWLEAASPVPIQRVVCPDIDLIRLPATTEPDMALARLGRMKPSDRGEPTALATLKRTRKPGRPRVYDAAIDRRVYDAHKHSRTPLPEIAGNFGMTPTEARRAYKRERKRRGRLKTSQE